MKNLFIGSNGLVAAIDSLNGSIIWEVKLDTGSSFLSSTQYQDVTILEESEYIFAGCNGHLFCLNAKTGKTLWHNKLSGWGNNDLSMSIGGKQIQAINKTEQK